MGQPFTTFSQTQLTIWFPSIKDYRCLLSFHSSIQCFQWGRAVIEWEGKRHFPIFVLVISKQPFKDLHYQWWRNTFNLRDSFLKHLFCTFFFFFLKWNTTSFGHQYFAKGNKNLASMTVSLIRDSLIKRAEFVGWR